MFDHLDDRGRVISLQPPVPVGQGAVHQGEPLSLHLGQAIQVQSRGRYLERTMRDVDSGDLLETLLLQQKAQEMTFATAEIQDAPGAALPEGGDHGPEALVVEAERLLQLVLLVRLRAVERPRVRKLLRHQTLQRQPREAALVLQVSAGDRLPLGMRGQPALPAAHEFLHLVVADPVVLVVVEDRNQHVQVRQELAEPPPGAQGHCEIPAGTPVGIQLVKRVLRGLHLVAQGLEQSAKERLASLAGQHRQPCLQRNVACRKLGTFLAGPGHGRGEDAGQGDAQEGRRDVGPIIDVLLEGAAFSRRTLATPHQPNRIDVQHQRRGAAPRRTFGIEDMRFAEGELELLRPIRVLVKQIPEISRRLDRGGQSEQQESPSARVQAGPVTSFRVVWAILSDVRAWRRVSSGPQPRPMSRRISWAAFQPQAPQTPPPGWVPAPHR